MPNTSPKEIQTEFKKWWEYHYYNIALSNNFIPIDSNDKIIEKREFLQKLIAGGYIPIKGLSDNRKEIYKLYKLTKDADAEIESQIKESSRQIYKNFKMENTKFPNFSFEDLEGNRYNNDAIKNKIVVLKCWFIACGACVEEFPELNYLVEKYGDRKDIVFISLATDSAESLYKFLEKKQFSYAVVPNQSDFMRSRLKVEGYPTHIIIDRGVIKKVVNSSSELEKALHKIIKEINNFTAPPPSPSPKQEI